MNVVIIEDEAPAFRRLQRILEEINPEVKIVEVLDSVEESVNWLSQNSPPDIIFMDIQLADGLSFEIFEQTEVKAPVIFTTAYDEYALKAFKVNSIDYLLKPIDVQLLRHALAKFESIKESYSGKTDLRDILRNIQPEKKQYKARFLVKQRERLLSIKTNEIAYLLSENGIVYLYTLGGTKYVFDKPLDQLEEQLDPSLFYRINRQCLAHVEAIGSAVAYDKGKMMVELAPKTPSPVLVSREKAADFKRWLDLG
ncbi:MAG: response regulator transcription factor [Flavobacteriales bacterium]|nr:response regulator transcription factor [Flavobacteriales bacterium]